MRWRSEKERTTEVDQKFVHRSGDIGRAQVRLRGLQGWREEAERQHQSVRSAIDRQKRLMHLAMLVSFILGGGCAVMVVGVVGRLSSGGNAPEGLEPWIEGWQTLRESRMMVGDDETWMLAFFGALTFPVLNSLRSGPSAGDELADATPVDRGRVETLHGMLIVALVFGSVASLWLAVPPDQDWRPHVSVLALMVAWLTFGTAAYLYVPRLPPMEALRLADARLCVLRTRISLVEAQAARRSGGPVRPMTSGAWLSLGAAPAVAVMGGGIIGAVVIRSIFAFGLVVGLAVTLLVTAPALASLMAPSGSWKSVKPTLVLLFWLSIGLIVGVWMVAAWVIWPLDDFSTLLTASFGIAVVVGLLRHRCLKDRIELSSLRAEVEQGTAQRRLFLQRRGGRATV